MREPGWITKAEAAERLQVDERTIERKARARKIASKARPGFPTWFWADDVEKLRHTGNGEVQTGVLEAGPASNGNGLQRHPAPLQNQDSATAVIVEALQALGAALSQGPIGPTGPTHGPTGPTLTPAEHGAQYLTLAEAAAHKRVSERLVRRWIREGALPVEREPRSVWTAADRGWRIRRKDLEAL
jgi:Helix-turn-helix domain